MASNTFGKLFTLTTFGESHGEVMGGIVDGCPANMLLSEADIQPMLNRRKPGQSAVTTQRQESDEIKILSGVFEGKTTGTPIGLQILNSDSRSRDYQKVKDVFRPGHGDYTYHKKYGIRDYRGGGRASARETAIWVAAGAIALKYLNLHQIKVQAAVIQIGELEAEKIDYKQALHNIFNFADPDPVKIEALQVYIESIRKQQDSVGAKIQVEISGVPAGIGEPVFDKLDAQLAKALMNINAVKAVEIGDGVAAASMYGSEFRDPMTKNGFSSNHAGGILAGISSGQPILATVTFKPTSSIPTPIQTVTESNEEALLRVTGRHDPCVGIRAVPIVEAMCAITILDNFLIQRGRYGHS